MKQTTVVATILLLGACAATQPVVDREAVEDFVAVRKPQEVDSIRIDATNDSWYELNPYYVIYETRHGSYLFLFTRRCWELDEQRVVADRRWDANTLRARFDTLRGCRIERMFEVSETDVTELKDLGAAPGSQE